LKAVWGDSFFQSFKPTQAVQSMAARSGLAGFGGGGMASAGATVNLQAGGRATNPATVRAFHRSRDRLKQLEQRMYDAEARGDYDTADEIEDILEGAGWMGRGGYQWFDPGFGYDLVSGAQKGPFGTDQIW